VLVPVGTTRTVEFVAHTSGDWAPHCHMTHHAMDQTGHGTPNLIGVDTKGLEPALRRQLPGYMTRGQTGMADKAQMDMAVPSNSVPMVGANGPFGYIDMGGMFTLLKVRDELSGYDADPGWCTAAAPEQARLASPDELRTEVEPS